MTTFRLGDGVHGVAGHLSTLSALLQRAEVTGSSGRSLPFDQACADAWRVIAAAHRRGNKLMFIGNGGSAAIASHMANDYARTARFRAMALNDPAVLTSVANDVGYESVFAEQIALHAAAGDVTIAISASGASRNVLHGVRAARDAGCQVITYSGLEPGNPLRVLGDINFYVESMHYGLVETAHLALSHALLDVHAEAGSR